MPSGALSPGPHLHTFYVMRARDGGPCFRPLLPIQVACSLLTCPACLTFCPLMGQLGQDSPPCKNNQIRGRRDTSTPPSPPPLLTASPSPSASQNIPKSPTPGIRHTTTSVLRSRGPGQFGYLRQLPARSPHRIPSHPTRTFLLRPSSSPITVSRYMTACSRTR